MRGIAGLTLALVLAGCGGTAAPTTGGGGAASRCVSVPAALVTAISSGLSVAGGGSLEDAAAVKSADYENAYFVSARITGEGIPSDTVGTWSTNGLDGSGSVFSAESFAGEFSDWGDGPGFSSSDDGFAESRDCVS